MKKILLATTFTLLAVISFAQSVVNRTTGTNTVADSRIIIPLNLFIPRYLDSNAATAAKGIDTLGALVFTYIGNKLLMRANNGGTKYWKDASGGGGGTLTNANNGLLLSGAIVQQGGRFIQNTTVSGANLFSYKYDSLTNFTVNALGGSANSSLRLVNDGTIELSGGNARLRYRGDTIISDTRAGYFTNINGSLTTNSWITKGYADSLKALSTLTPLGQYKLSFIGRNDTKGLIPGLWTLMDSSATNVTVRSDSAAIASYIRGTIPVANSFVYRDSASAINIVSLGAVGDGTTDNAAIFKTARNLAKTYGYAIFIPAGTFYTSDSVLLNKVSMFGNGINSVIKFTSTSLPAPIVLQDSCRDVYDLKLIGSGIGTIPGGIITSQNGIKINGSGNVVRNCSFTNMNGAAIGIWETAGGSTYSNIIVNNIIRNCTVGIFPLINAEQNVITGNEISYCVVGLWNRNSGNNTVAPNEITYCTDGYRSTGGGNADHNTIVALRSNHCTNLLNIESADLGMSFGYCDFFSGNILIGSVGAANKVIISNSNLKDVVITGTNTANSVVRDNNYLGTVTTAGSGILYVNNNNSSDPQYFRSNLNVAGANSFLNIGSSDAFDFTIKTNNTARLNILSTGEVGIGTAAAAGFKVFIASAGNTDATYHQLWRNGDGINLFTLQNGGTFSLGNPSVSSNTGTIYGQLLLANTNLGTAITDSVLVITSGNVVKAIGQNQLVGAVPTLQQVFATQSNAPTLTSGDSHINIQNGNFQFDSVGSFYVIRPDGTNILYFNGSSTTINSGNNLGSVSAQATVSVMGHVGSGKGNYITVYDDSVTIHGLTNSGTWIKYTKDSLFIKQLASIGASARSNIVVIDTVTGQMKMIPQSVFGSVTSVATGLGLSGGTITTTGTIIVDTTKILDKLVGTNITGAMQFTSLLTAKAGINLPSTAAPLQLAGSAGTSGQLLQSGGAGVTPSWISPASLSGLPYWKVAGTTTLTGGTVTIQGSGDNVNFFSNDGFAIDGNDVQLGDVTGSGTGAVLHVQKGTSTMYFDDLTHGVKLGIGTSTPTVALDVKGGGKYNLGTSDNFNIISDTYVDGLFKVQASGIFNMGDYSADVNNTSVIINDPASTIDMVAISGYTLSGGAVTISNLSAGGAITAGAGTGTLSVVSDPKVKHDISSYPYGIKQINATNPIIFRYNDDQKMGSGLYAGFNATEVYNIYGSLGAGTTKEGLHTLFDRAILAAAVNGEKQLYQMVIDLKKEFEDYKKTHP